MENGVAIGLLARRGAAGPSGPRNGRQVRDAHGLGGDHRHRAERTGLRRRHAKRLARGERMTNRKLSTLGWLAVSVGGLGALRPAPGTWGSLPPVIMALGAVWCLSEQGFSQQDHTTVQYLMLLLTALGSAAVLVLWPSSRSPLRGERSFAGGGRRNRRSGAGADARRALGGHGLHRQHFGQWCFGRHRFRAVPNF